MIVQSTRFGELDVPDGQILDFSQGIMGFPEEKRFALMEYKPDSPFYFLQSLADPDLTFLLIILQNIIIIDIGYFLDIRFCIGFMIFVCHHTSQNNKNNEDDKKYP